MMKNRKGFTLIELIVTIAILGAVFVAASYELTNVLKNSRKSESLSYIEDILDSASTYIAMTKKEVTVSEEFITLGDIVSSGLISDSIYKAINGFTCRPFSEGLEIYYILNTGQKRLYIHKTGEDKCYLDKIDECKELIKDC